LAWRVNTHIRHRRARAIAYLQVARDTCPMLFVEYAGAIAELKVLGALAAGTL
jgi:hypothetical protein